MCSSAGRSIWLGMCSPRTPSPWSTAALVLGALSATVGSAAAAEATHEPYFSFDACDVRPADYRLTVALAIDGTWQARPLDETDAALAAPSEPAEPKLTVIEVGPWGLRIRLNDDEEPLLLFFEQGEVWDFDPPPWMPRPDPASRVSENHRLEIEFPCPQHRLPRIYGAGRSGDDETIELFLTVLSPDRIAGREIRRSDAGTESRTLVLERYSSSP